MAYSTSMCSVGQCSDSVVRPASTNVTEFKVDLAANMPVSHCEGVVYMPSDMLSRRRWRHHEWASDLASLS